MGKVSPQVRLGFKSELCQKGLHSILNSRNFPVNWDVKSFGRVFWLLNGSSPFHYNERIQVWLEQNIESTESWENQMKWVRKCLDWPSVAELIGEWPIWVLKAFEEEGLKPGFGNQQWRLGSGILRVRDASGRNPDLADKPLASRPPLMSQSWACWTTRNWVVLSKNTLAPRTSRNLRFPCPGGLWYFNRWKSHFENGKSVQALMATTCIPGVFSPVHGRANAGGRSIGGKRPLTVLKEMGASVRVGVSLGSESYRKPENLIQVIINAINIVIDQTNLASEGKFDLMLKPELQTYGFLDNGIPKLFAEGYRSAMMALEKVRSMIDVGTFSLEQVEAKFLKWLRGWSNRSFVCLFFESFLGVQS